jgi:hypothetical protein
MRRINTTETRSVLVSVVCVSAALLNVPVDDAFKKNSLSLSEKDEENQHH